MLLIRQRMNKTMEQVGYTRKKKSQMKTELMQSKRKENEKMLLFSKGTEKTERNEFISSKNSLCSFFCFSFQMRQSQLSFFFSFLCYVFLFYSIQTIIEVEAVSFLCNFMNIGANKSIKLTFRFDTKCF